MDNDSLLKQCENGHYYQGDHCPYCPKVYDKETRLYPRAGCVSIPLCSHCGKPLRKEEYIYHRIGIMSVGSVGNSQDRKIPWNYGWNGRCDNCGHDYNINIGQKLGGVDLGNKHTSVRVDSRSYRYSYTDECDTSIVLSGVEIETFVEQRGDTTKQKIFLSTNELKYLLKVLSNSPILKQEDCDREKGMNCT